MTPLHDLNDDDLVAAARRAVRALPDAPEAWVQRAIDLLPVPSLVGTLLRRLQAVLSFDSWAQPAPALGMRSAADDTRHLLFSVEGRDIDLRIVPAGATWALAGQVLGPDEAGTVELAGGDGARRTPLDELGEFRIEGLASGRYTLTLRVAGDEILLPALEVGPR